MTETPLHWRAIVRDPVLIATLAALLVLKFALLAIYGPGHQPDTIGYLRFALEILQGTDWPSQVPLRDHPAPTTAARTIGYPAILALAMAVSEDHWGWLVISAQIALSTFSLAFCFALARALGANRFMAAFAIFAAGSSMSLPIDLSLLTDSFAASCWTIALAWLSLGAVARKRLHWPEALGIGLLLTAGMLLREGTAVLAFLFLLPLTARMVRMASPVRWHSAAAALLIFLPLLATSQAYQIWNEHRTGYRFVTTGGETTYLMGLAKAARYDPSIFSGDSALDRNARDLLVEHSFAEIFEVIVRLHRAGMTAPEMAALMQQRYLLAWRDHPAAMIRLMGAHLRENFLLPTFRPLGSVREAVFWITSERPWPAYPELKQRALGDRQPIALALFAFELAETLAALALDLIFLAAPVFWLLLVRPSAPYWRAMTTVGLSLWLLCLAFLAAHAAVHFEHRYAAPVLPFILILVVTTIQAVAVSARCLWVSHADATVPSSRQ